jgi:flavin reductase (DIM6/NTAB) family NADH-FMN oxidoreductase RutF
MKHRGMEVERDGNRVLAFHYLLHPYHTSLVTCCDAEGQANIITIAWLIPVSVEPPLVGMSIRPSRYSYGLIHATGEFVINVAPYEIAQQVLFCGRRSGRNVDKFAATGLTAGPAQLVQPPVIAECVAHLECRVVQDVEAGDHRLVVAEVLAAYARPGVLDDDNLYNLRHVNPLLHLGRNRFTSTRAQSVEPTLEPGGKQAR